jgi:oligogalacturonide lyase
MLKTFLLSLALLPAVLRAADPPIEWIDPDTHHRIVRLSTEGGTESLYFHQNAYSPDGSKLMVSTPSGIATIDLQTRDIDPIVTGRVRPIMTARKSGDIYYFQGGGVFAVNPSDRKPREIVTKLPPGGVINCINADETLLAGTITHRSEGQADPATRPTLSKGARIDARYNLHLPMELFTIDIKSGPNFGEVKTFHPSTEWLNHLQFSPTDPNQILFCHEGPWHKVDRTWLIKADGSNLVQVHQRTMQMEIEGHEFFAQDGKSVWYDLQTPRGEDFWLGGYEIATGARTWYHLQRDEWSVHFNVSRDGKLFAGDGGSEGMVAHAKDGKWIYLFRPELNNNRAADVPGQDKLIRTGVFHAERLVNMSKQDYSLEPNVTFTPDGKRIVFRSNMFGPTHVFAVDIEPAGTP